MISGKLMSGSVCQSRRNFSMAIVGVALFAAQSGAVPAQAQEATDWAKIEAAAKKEGRLVFYNGTTRTIPENIAKAFEKRYGIQVDVLPGTAGQIRERIGADTRLADISATSF